MSLLRGNKYRHHSPTSLHVMQFNAFLSMLHCDSELLKCMKCTKKYGNTVLFLSSFCLFCFVLILAIDEGEGHAKKANVLNSIFHTSRLYQQVLGISLFNMSNGYAQMRLEHHCRSSLSHPKGIVIYFNVRASNNIEILRYFNYLLGNVCTFNLE